MTAITNTMLMIAMTTMMTMMIASFAIVVVPLVLKPIASVSDSFGSGDSVGMTFSIGKP